MFHRAFPDAHRTLEELLAEGDKVVVRRTLRGTHHGEFLGLAPTGKAIVTRGISIYRLADGQLVEHWVNYDVLGLHQQLGASSASAQAGG
jgi:predicted ester cyclase